MKKEGRSKQGQTNNKAKQHMYMYQCHCSNTQGNHGSHGNCGNHGNPLFRHVKTQVSLPCRGLAATPE